MTRAIASDADDRDRGDERQAAAAPVGDDERLRLDVARPPRQDRRRQDVVVDLVAAVVARPQDPASRERLEHGERLLVRHVPRSRRGRGRRGRSWRPTASRAAGTAPTRSACCAGVNVPIARSRWAATICAAPPRRSSVAARNVEEPCCRSTSQSRSITSWRYGASIRSSPASSSTAPLPPRPLRIRPAATWSRTASVSAGSISTGSPPSSCQRASGCSTAALPCLAGEAVEAQVVVENAGNRGLEAVELRERILAQREEDVDPGRAAEDRGQLLLERVALRGGRGSTPRPGRAEGRPGPGPRPPERPRSRGTRWARLRPRRRCPRRSQTTGRSDQAENSTTTGRSGRSRSCLATAAARSDDLPTPLGP